MALQVLSLPLLRVLLQVLMLVSPRGATGSVSISATYASIHVARSTAGFATGYAIGNGMVMGMYPPFYFLYVGAASTESTGSMLDEEKLVLVQTAGPTGSH